MRDYDVLPVKTVSLSSPLQIVFAITGTIGLTGLSLNRLAVAAKAWIDVLAAGLDLQERKEALDRGRTLAPLHLQEAQLRNEFLTARLRRVTAPSQYGLVDQARRGTLEYPDDRDEFEPRRPEYPDDGDDEFEPTRHYVAPPQRFADSMSTLEFAELLGEPVDRMLGYSGGEWEVAGDEESSE